MRHIQQQFSSKRISDGVARKNSYHAKRQANGDIDSKRDEIPVLSHRRTFVHKRGECSKATTKPRGEHQFHGR